MRSAARFDYITIVYAYVERGVPEYCFAVAHRSDPSKRSPALNATFQMGFHEKLYFGYCLIRYRSFCRMVKWIVAFAAYGDCIATRWSFRLEHWHWKVSDYRKFTNEEYVHTDRLNRLMINWVVTDVYDLADFFRTRFSRDYYLFHNLFYRCYLYICTICLFYVVNVAIKL
jgi:hypothetical protein